MTMMTVGVALVILGYDEFIAGTDDLSLAIVGDFFDDDECWHLEWNAVKTYRVIKVVLTL